MSWLLPTLTLNWCSRYHAVAARAAACRDRHEKPPPWVVASGAGIRVRAGAGIGIGSRVRVPLRLFVVTQMYWLPLQPRCRTHAAALLAFVMGEALGSRPGCRGIVSRGVAGNWYVAKKSLAVALLLRGVAGCCWCRGPFFSCQNRDMYLDTHRKGGCRAILFQDRIPQIARGFAERVQVGHCRQAA